MEEIAKQVELYFSHIDTDRYLQRKYEISRDGCNLIILSIKIDVPLKTLLTFKKLKSMTRDERQVARALSLHATTVKLNNDQTGVALIESHIVANSFRARTIYVENLPRSLSREDLKKVVEVFGTVTYIEMEYMNKRNNGFAFIEYEQPAHAEEALEFLAASQNDQSETVGEGSREQLKRALVSWKLRSMSKSRWLELMREYWELQTSRQRVAQEQLREDYQRHTFIMFNNIIPDSNKGLLRVSSKEVAEKFMDHFKTNLIEQESCGDTIGIPATEHDAITLEFLSKEEELCAWDKAIKDRKEFYRLKVYREEKHKGQAHRKKQTEEQPSVRSNNPASHKRFRDYDSDTEQEAHQKKQKPEE